MTESQLETIAASFEPVEKEARAGGDEQTISNTESKRKLRKCALAF